MQQTKYHQCLLAHEQTFTTFGKHKKNVHMKLRISTLSLFFLSILILSSCFKARYGSLTRSTRVKHIVHSPVKDVHLKQQVENSKTQNVVINDLNLTEPSGQAFVEKGSTINLPQTKVNESRLLAKNADAELKVVPAKHKAGLPKALLSQKPLNQLKKMNDHFAKKIESQQMSKGSDVGNVLYILAIILLVLLILALFSKFGGLLVSLVGLALLVLLIYIVIQMI